MSGKLLYASAALGVALGSSSLGLAQELALERFHPAPAGDRMFGVQSPTVDGHLDVNAMLLFDYAHNPLVLRQTTDDDDLGSVVSNQLFAHANGSIALWNRLNLNLDVPVALVQSGDDPAAGAVQASSPDSVDLGDIRLGARVGLLGRRDDLFQLGFATYVWVPTGTGDFVGSDKVRALPEVIAGGRYDRLLWTAAVGTEIQSSQDVLGEKQGTSLRGGAGVGYVLLPDERLQVGAEATVSTVLEDPSEYNTNAEILFDGRYRLFDGLEAGVGIGPGLTSGVGTPDFRAVAMITYHAQIQKPEPPPPPDGDSDGIADAQDACPAVAGEANADPKKNGCPPDADGDGIIDAQDACAAVPGVANTDPAKNGCPPDADGDGIIDSQDACPEVAGVANEDASKNGCPPDTDGDGVADALDACPDIKGVATDDPKTNGCPPDSDGDGIRDDKDACVADKGVADPDPAKNGCPTVRVTQQEIEILQQVEFDTGKATIRPTSSDLLDQVAAALKAHPEILKVEVQGHTDDRGGKAANKMLSQARATSVRQALIKRGIEGRRMVAKGYGQEKPIADNATEEGRQKNRRVQFVITERKPKEAP